MIRILEGDVRGRLADLADDSLDCIVTSPPYWGLRDYGVAGQIGLEPTLTEYLDTMVDVCRELRRVLKPRGTCWINLGDSYGAFKQINMVPNRLAIRLQEDGWCVRSEIIWHKPNPMPESVTDRPTSSHEKIWLLTKSERYWYDAEAIREDYAESTLRIHSSDGVRPRGDSVWKTNSVGNGHSGVTNGLGRLANGKRNARNVWTIASQPYSEAHFATFPPELAERCIRAGCAVGGHVLDPFAGAGTTGMVADRLGRDATLIELNPSYVSLIKSRIIQDAGMFAQVAAE